MVSCLASVNWLIIYIWNLMAEITALYNCLIRTNLWCIREVIIWLIAFIRYLFLSYFTGVGVAEDTNKLNIKTNKQKTPPHYCLLWGESSDDFLIKTINAESISISWRHNVNKGYYTNSYQIRNVPSEIILKNLFVIHKDISVWIHYRWYLRIVTILYDTGNDTHHKKYLW